MGKRKPPDTSHWLVVPCPTCGGTGTRRGSACPLCEGNHVITVPPLDEPDDY